MSSRLEKGGLGARDYPKGGTSSPFRPRIDRGSSSRRSQAKNAPSDQHLVRTTPSSALAAERTSGSLSEPRRRPLQRDAEQLAASSRCAAPRPRPAVSSSRAALPRS